MGAEAGATNGFLLNTSKTIQVRPSTVLLNISCIIIGIIDIIYIYIINYRDYLTYHFENFCQKKGSRKFHVTSLG